MSRSLALFRWLAVRLAITPTLLLVALSPLGAQQVFSPTTDLDFDHPEAWAMKFFSSASMLTALGEGDLEAGELELGVEALHVPHLDTEQRTVGFGGTKEEDLNRSPAWARLRLGIGLPAGFRLTLAATPPVEVDGVEALLYSAALSRALFRGDSWRLDARLFAQDGTAEGDFTCSESDAAATPGSPENSFFCEAPSNDEVTLAHYGAQLTARFDIDDGAELYVGVLGTEHDLEFQVDARTAGNIDRSLLLADGFTWGAVLGADIDLGERSALAVEAFYSPLDVQREGQAEKTDDILNVRGMLRFRLR